MGPQYSASILTASARSSSVEQPEARPVSPHEVLTITNDGFSQAHETPIANPKSMKILKINFFILIKFKWLKINMLKVAA